MPKNNKEWRKDHDDHVADEDGKYLFLVDDEELLNQIVEEHNIVRRFRFAAIHKWLAKVRKWLAKVRASWPY